MTRRGKFIPLAACAVLFALSLTACKSEAQAGSSEAGAAMPSPTAAGCSRPGEKVRHWLPVFDAKPDTAGLKARLQNPCPPFLDLASQIEQIVPSAERKAGRSAAQLIDAVHGMAGKFLAAADTAKCFYEADRLAIGVYQHRDYAWSVGVVLVVRGGAGAVADLASCYLLGQPFPDQGVLPPAEETEMKPDFCPRGFLGKRNGETYGVIWIGSSTWMCSALARGIPAE